MNRYPVRFVSACLRVVPETGYAQPNNLHHWTNFGSWFSLSHSKTNLASIPTSIEMAPSQTSAGLSQQTSTYLAPTPFGYLANSLGSLLAWPPIIFQNCLVVDENQKIFLFRLVELIIGGSLRALNTTVEPRWKTKSVMPNYLTSALKCTEQSLFSN